MAAACSARSLAASRAPWPVLLAVLMMLVLARAGGVPGPYTIFKTEPTYIPTPINATYLVHDRSLLAPGYFFVAPRTLTKTWGPQIVDQDGGLVWYGEYSVGVGVGERETAPGTQVHRTQAFAACDYLGSAGDHLCYAELTHRPGMLSPTAVHHIFNSSYVMVARYERVGNFSAANPHEMTVAPGGRNLVRIVWPPRRMDLRPYFGERNGFVLDGCIQDVDLETGTEIFRWCFLDHYPIWETYLYLNVSANTVNMTTGNVGAGLANGQRPWDFMHLNSVDKDHEGNYIVSARHMNALYKIAGPNNPQGVEPGTTLWQFGGKRSDFDISASPALNLTGQHDVRVVSTTRTETRLTVFDNGHICKLRDDRGLRHDESAGLVITLNNATMTAALDAAYTHPRHLLSCSQGSVQLLPNGNALVGWGSWSDWSEHSAAGRILYNARAWSDDPQAVLENYRVHKAPWRGRPLTQPKLVAYRRACSRAPLVAYVSWNGATDVAAWRFQVSFGDRGGPWVPAGTFPRAGFETAARLAPFLMKRPASFAPYVAVDALDANGTVLASVTRGVFVPKQRDLPHCDDRGCARPERFRYDLADGSADQCSLGHMRWLPQAAAMVLMVLWVESITYLLQGSAAPQYVLRRVVDEKTPIT